MVEMIEEIKKVKQPTTLTRSTSRHIDSQVLMNIPTLIGADFWDKLDLLCKEYDIDYNVKDHDFFDINKIN